MSNKSAPWDNQVFQQSPPLPSLRFEYRQWQQPPLPQIKFQHTPQGADGGGGGTFIEPLNSEEFHAK